MPLPDNRMKPKQSGNNVWLQEQIIERLVGNDKAQEIITEASTHAPKRYEYMLGQLTRLGHTDIVEEYRERINADQRQRHRALKTRHLAGYQAQLETCTDPQRSVYLRRQIQKIEGYLREKDL